jgi:CO/xanthine dehydrogenase Mo-binding subunit
LNDINASIPKIDGPEKLSGRALYAADITVPGVLQARTVRSTRAHATIEKIDLPALPSGYFTVSASDIPGKNIVKMIYDDLPFFADGVVRHIGEPILLLVGPDATVLEELKAKTIITYNDLPPVFDFSASVVTLAFQKGDPETAFRTAREIVEETFTTGYQEQAYIEPQGFVAIPEANGKVQLIGSIQCPYYVKNAVIQALGCRDDQVRVIQPAVGGAFGGKEEYPSIIACQLAVAVRKIGQPIRLIFEREEDMVATTKRHPSTITLRAAIDTHGNVAAIDAHVGLDGGAYIGLSGVVLSRAMIAVTGAYTIPNLSVKGDVYKTNTVPTGAFRGFGAPQMLFAIEMLMQHLGKRFSDDAVMYRIRHLAKQNDPTSTNGVFRDPIILPELIQAATSKADFFAKSKTYQNAKKHRGVGMSFFLHGCGFTGSGEAEHIHAKVKLVKTKDDVVHVYIAAVDMGQGIKTTIVKIVAGVLDVPLHQVVFDNPDTDFVPDSGPTVASRTTMIVGGLCARAAAELKTLWQAKTEQTVWKHYEQPSYIEWDQDTLTGDAYPAYSWGVNIVEVDVDPDTYQVDVLKMTSAYDLGKAIDQRIVQGQIDGGQAQGIAYGYLEVMEQVQGRLRQTNLTDYIIPTVLDIPPMEAIILDNPYPLGPYGAKGVGELTLVGGAPAIAMAIEMAIGKPINQIPATPERIRRWLKP